MIKTQFLAPQSERKHGNILGVPLNSTSVVKVLAFVRDSLARKHKFTILTPNPEIMLMAREDPGLALSLRQASLSIPDGIGLAQAAKFLSLRAPEPLLLRVPVSFLQGLGVGLSTFFAKDWLFKTLPIFKGREIFMELMKLANKKGWRVFFLGGEADEAKVAGERLRRSLKRVRIAYSAGPALDIEAKPVSPEDKDIEVYTIKQINEFKPQILFVAFGAPKQEKWLIKWLSNLEVGGGMVVGGAFRYISGQAKLPPKWMEGWGEWVSRLVYEPWRLKRILTAFPIFPLKVFFHKLNTP